MKKKLLVLCCLSVLSVPACEPFSETNQGFLFASVKFPTGGFKIKAIPVNTAAIEVQVSGNGIANPIKFSLSPNKPTITIKKIPTGNKEINVIAKDTVGKSLATGNGSIDVKENTLNRVEITLNHSNSGRVCRCSPCACSAFGCYRGSNRRLALSE